MTQTFTILGDPRPQGRPRFYRRGNFVGAYDPKKSREYKQTLAAQIAAHNPEYIPAVSYTHLTLPTISPV